MKDFQALNHLDEDSPNLIFLKEGLFLLTTGDSLIQITTISKLHYDATLSLMTFRLTYQRDYDASSTNASW